MRHLNTSSSCLWFSFGWSCSADSRQIMLDSFSILDLLFVFSIDVGRTSALVMACVIFCVAGVLINESWFMLILSWWVFIEVAWIMDEVWITVEVFVIWSENALKSIWCCSFHGISLGKGFWGVNTLQNSIQKRLKQSTLNFAHAFPTAAVQKDTSNFSNNELCMFNYDIATSFELKFGTRTIRSIYCLSLGFLYLGGRKLLKTTTLLVYQLIK